MSFRSIVKQCAITLPIMVAGFSGLTTLATAQDFLKTNGNYTLTGIGQIDPGNPISYNTTLWTNNTASILVGYGTNGSNDTEAYIWSSTTGIRGLGFLGNPAGATSLASIATQDGSAVFGYSTNANNNIEAFRWTPAGGMQGLGFLASETVNSRSVIQTGSEDASVVVGYSTNATSHIEAIRWTEATGMQGLGFIGTGGSFPTSQAIFASQDGHIVYGVSTNSDNQQSAFQWTEQTGMVSFQAILESAGVDLGGWQLITPTFLTRNDEIIVGLGLIPSGNYEPFILVLSNPTEPPVSPENPGNSDTDTDTNTDIGILPTPPAIGFINPTEMNASVHDTAVKVLQVQNVSSSALSDVRFAATEQCAPWENPDNRFCAFISGSAAFWGSNGDYGKGNLFSGSAGISMKLLPGFAIGAAFTAGTADYDLRLGGKNKLTSYGTSVYATYAPAKTGLQLLGAVTTSWHDMDISRSYMNGSRASVMSKGSSDGQSWGALGRVGWRFSVLDKTWVMPYAEIEWLRSRVGAYQEDGGPFPIAFKGQTARELDGRLGLEIRHEFSDRLEIFANAAWVHRFSGNATSLEGIMVETFDVSSGAVRMPKKDWAEVAVGGSWKITPDTRLSGSVSTALSKSNRPDATVRIGVSTDF